MNKKVGRKTLLWKNFTDFCELCSIHGQSVIKITIYRHNSKIYADGDLTFAVGEQCEHELVLMALCSRRPTFKAKFTVQILKKLNIMQHQSVGSAPSNHFRLQQNATFFWLSVQFYSNLLHLHSMWIGCWQSPFIKSSLEYPLLFRRKTRIVKPLLSEETHKHREV